jgi:hypothetical protein
MIVEVTDVPPLHRALLRDLAALTPDEEAEAEFLYDVWERDAAPEPRQVFASSRTTAGDLEFAVARVKSVFLVAIWRYADGVIEVVGAPPQRRGTGGMLAMFAAWLKVEAPGAPAPSNHAGWRG